MLMPVRAGGGGEMDEETLNGYSRNNCPCFRSKVHPLLATGSICINGLTDVPNLDTGQVQFPQQEHLLLYRITVHSSRERILLMTARKWAWIRG